MMIMITYLCWEQKKKLNLCVQNVALLRWAHMNGKSQNRKIIDILYCLKSFLVNVFL